LKDGGHTEIIFYKDDQGTTHPFPSENADIVWNKGTEESENMLEKIIMDGVAALSDRVYIAFMGPPIPPYRMRCYCGHEIRVGHDDNGCYIEGAAEVIFEPTDKPKT